LGAPVENRALTNRDDDAAICIDATGTLQSLDIAPTGIPRVEEAIVQCALADADARVDVVRYDRRLRAFRQLNEGERRRIRSHNDVLPVTGPGGHPQVRQVLTAIARNPYMSRDSDRHFAELVSGSKRNGLSYQVAKLLFRAWRLICLFVASLAEGRVQGTRAIPPGSTVLLSNAILLGQRLNAALRSTTSPAFICHDLIPVIAPRFAVDAQHVRRFADNIETAMRVCTAVLCTSKTSHQMAADYCRSLRIEQPPLLRFPMPSALHERAGKFAATTDQIPDGPFVLYCSTVEVRKNHLLLARIWLRALNEGVALPRLVCAGKWGWGVEELKDFLSAHPELSARMIFTGPVSDAQLIGLYRRAEFGVIPSFIEGWGYSASECLDFKVPVIVSNSPALREATHGIMPSIDIADEDGWYREIRRLSEDEGYRAELRRRIAERHRAVAAAESWAAIKNALLDPVPSTTSIEQTQTRNAESDCTITVAVTTTDPPPAVLPRLASLAEQTRRIGGELMLVSGAAQSEFDEAALCGVRVHHLPGRTIFECRAAALELASSNIVALTEDHCEHPDDWCARILENYASSSRLVLLGGAVSNGSTRRLDDLMNFWMTFGPFAPGQVVAKHPCVAQFIVRKTAVKLPLRPGELESSVIQKFEKVPGAVRVDPQLCVRHVQSHGLRNTFTIHFHNGRATAGLSPRRAGTERLTHLRALRYSWSDSKAHFRISTTAFMQGTRSRTRTAAYLALIFPLLLMHAAGEYVGYRYGPGSSAAHLV
jgi:glycosyltransferase involved in cell wall biosynthesis